MGQCDAGGIHGSITDPRPDGCRIGGGRLLLPGLPLDLNRCMVDVKTLRQEILDLIQNRTIIGLQLDLYVDREGRDAGPNQPGVEIVHGGHVWNRADCRFQIIDVDPFRGAFEQHIHRAPDQPVGAGHDQQRDQDREEWIGLHQPVKRIIPPATITPIDPMRSLITSRYAASMFKLCEAPPCSRKARRD